MCYNIKIYIYFKTLHANQKYNRDPFLSCDLQFGNLCNKLSIRLITTKSYACNLRNFSHDTLGKTTYNDSLLRRNHTIEICFGYFKSMRIRNSSNMYHLIMLMNVSIN